MRHQQRIVLDQALTASARAADALVVPREVVHRVLQLPQPGLEPAADLLDLPHLLSCALAHRASSFAPRGFARQVLKDLETESARPNHECARDPGVQEGSDSGVGLRCLGSSVVILAAVFAHARRE